MAFIACPGCGKKISDKAPRCFSCGWVTPLEDGGEDVSPAPGDGPAVGYGTAGIPAQGASPGTAPFFPVATHKFAVMSLFSLGVYPVYWSYQNWKRIRTATGENLSPFWRAFFTPFWTFSLFRRVRARAEREQLPVGWSPDLLALLYLLLLLASWFGSWGTLISLAGFVTLIPVLSTTRAVNARHPSGEGPNSSYSFANIGCILLGGALLVLAILGMLLIGSLTGGAAGGPRRGEGGRAGAVPDSERMIQDPKACTQRAGSYAEQGDLPEATVLLDRCIDAHPDHRDAYVLMDQILASGERYETIVGYWDRYLERNPDDASAIFERAGALLHMGQADRARMEAQRACDLGLQAACLAVSGGR